MIEAANALLLDHEPWRLRRCLGFWPQETFCRQYWTFSMKELIACSFPSANQLILNLNKRICLAFFNLTKTRNIHNWATDRSLCKQTFVCRQEKGAGALEAIFIGKEEKHFGSKTEVRLSG